jgi:hypothetical protein
MEQGSATLGTRAKEWHAKDINIGTFFGIVGMQEAQKISKSHVGKCIVQL